MSYTAFDPTKPDGGTQTPGEMGVSMRDNAFAVVHALLSGVGWMPGWSMQAQDTDGTYPPSDPETPGQWLASSGVYRIKVTPTWNGSVDGQLDSVVVAYSANSGSSYDTIGTASFTYDASGNWIQTTWS